MMRLYFIGEGKRDWVVMPRLVEGILEQQVQASGKVEHDWPRLHGKSYPEKLLFAVREAESRAMPGVVATRDGDKWPKKRLKSLRDAREFVANRSPLPLAVGCPIPHAEAWLLDDPVAVRSVLSLPTNATIPTVRQSPYPKRSLDELINLSPRRDEDSMKLLSDISANVTSARCVHWKETGFKAFLRTVTEELQHLAKGEPK